MGEIVRAGTALLTFGEELVQVGSSPEHSFCVMGLDPFTTAWLRRLLELRVIPGPEGLSREQLLLVEQLRRYGLIEKRKDPLEKLRVRIVGLDRTGISIARALKDAGARYVDVRGSGIITHELADLFPGVPRGKDRKAALLEDLAAPGMYLGRQGWPDLAISVEQRVLDIHRGARFLQRDVTHLPVILDDRSVQVGPLLVPGASACYLCLEHHRKDVIPTWPQTRRQLEVANSPNVGKVLSRIAADFTAHVVHAIARNDPGEAWFWATSWRLSDRGVETSRWKPHPACGCSEERLFPKQATARDRG